MSIIEHGSINAGTAAEAIAPVTWPLPRRAEARSTPGRFRWLLTREAIGNLLLVALMVSVVWVSIGAHLTQQRLEVNRGAQRDSSNLAQAAAQSIGQTIASVDDALRLMRAIYIGDPIHFDIAVWANRLNRTHGIALEFALIDRDGKLVADSLGPVTTPGDFSDQEFFKRNMEDAQDGLFISKPIAARTSGRWSLLLSRRITAADGWFTGVIAATVDPSWLTRLHRSLDTGRGALMLVGTDGRIRALALGSAPDSVRGIGEQIDLTALRGAPEYPERGTLSWVNPVDGARQVASFQRLADDGAYVIVGLDEDEIFAPYMRYARQYELFGSGITLLILVAGGLLLNNTRRLLASRQVLRDAMDAVSQGIVMVDTRGHVAVINRRAGELLGTPHRLAGGSHPASAPDIELLHGEGSDADQTYERVCDNGTILEVDTHVLGSGGVVRTYNDVTERKRAEAQILHLAMHDGLTGLPNRRLLAEQVAHAVDQANKGGPGGAVLLVDLDRFKNINDACGHSFGDRVLLHAASRLRGIVGNAGLVTRIGGDEFCVLQGALTGSAAPEALAREVVRLLSEPYQIDGQEVLLSASVGIARFPANGSSADQLLTNADTAMYRAKEDGGATFRAYEPAMDLRIAERRRLEQDLRNALGLEQLSIVYQPVLDIANGEITGFEALLRWFHPTRGAISPGEFIPIAEECGVIVPLGFWVMGTACAEAVKWSLPLRVAINLSPKQFWQKDLPDRVATILAETGLSADRLVLEVTEGVLIDNRQRALSAMAALKAQGIRIALDDFGTGYSSLSYLHRFPFDSIKIDRSFVSNLSQDDVSRTIVRTILTLGRSLRLNVVAEGVEFADQLRWLRAVGCGEVQGFLLGRPMPSDRIANFLSAANSAPVGTRVADAAN